VNERRPGTVNSERDLEAPRNTRATISAVVLAYGQSPTLRECINALTASTGVDLEVVVVDNGCDPEVLDSVRSLERVAVVGRPVNRGFAGGCNYGVQHSKGDLIALVNDDAIVRPDALAQLGETLAADSQVGIASASLRLYDAPNTMNSAGNPVHYTGVTWSGSFGQSAELHSIPTDITSATGAAMLISREVWDELGGFDEAYFAYLEDTDLSLRCWQSGLRVRYVPSAVVLHHYEFSRTPGKLELLERNRWLFLLTLFEARTLRLLAPALMLVELAMLGQSLVGGWVKQKVGSYAWLVRNRDHIRRRRTLIQSSRVLPDRELLDLFAARIEPANVPIPPGMGALNTILAHYWRWARRRLRSGSG
jgi:GT2 family glycosyltransferase